RPAWRPDLLQPLDENELGRVRQVRPDAGLPVDREQNRRDRAARTRTSGRNLLPELAPAIRRVDPIDASGHDALTRAQLVCTANGEQAVRRRLDRLLAGQDPYEFAGLARFVHRIEAPR